MLRVILVFSFRYKLAHESATFSGNVDLAIFSFSEDTTLKEHALKVSSPIVNCYHRTIISPV